MAIKSKSKRKSWKKKKSWFKVMSGNASISGTLTALSLPIGYFESLRYYLENIKEAKKFRIKMEEAVDRNMQINFQKQRDSTGRPWKKLAFRTGEDREKLGVGKYSPMLMRKKGRMFHSATGSARAATDGSSRNSIKIAKVGKSYNILIEPNLFQITKIKEPKSSYGKKAKIQKPPPSIALLYERHNRLGYTKNPNPFPNKHTRAKAKPIPGREFYYLNNDTQVSFAAILVDDLIDSATKANKGKTHAGQQLKALKKKQKKQLD